MGHVPKSPEITTRSGHIIKKNVEIDKCVNCLQNAVFFMFIASKLVAFWVIEVGGVCMGRGYFM